MAPSIEEIVAGYFKYLGTEEDAYFWAWLAVDDMCHTLHNGMLVTLRLIELAPTKKIRNCVAAHALEDLVNRLGTPAVLEIDRLATASKALRLALPVVIVNEDSEVFELWEQVLNRHKESDGGNAL